MSNIRGIRGAITVSGNTKAEIFVATKKLLKEMVKKNKIKVNDVASVFFSATSDINADFPSKAARSIGWTLTPLICMNEIDVPGALKKCIRVLMHVNSDLPQAGIKHVYLGGAKTLRPDIK
jgi:chorismate mutase